MTGGNKFDKNNAVILLIDLKKNCYEMPENIIKFDNPF